MVKKLLLAAVLFLPRMTAWGQPFSLPTANHALFEPGGEEKFFVATPGHTWTSGCFGCVRSNGRQMHEGLDIKCLQRDRRGEPIDPVLTTADGTVVYMADKPSLSNYGRYLVLLHHVDGIEVYSLYAHLSAFAHGLKVGQTVRRGEQVAMMGHTGAGLSRDRAHVHFEFNLFYNDHFAAWFKKHYPTEHDDHGIWNGQNLVGFDPRLVFLDERREGENFSLLHWLQGRTELCRVQVRQASLSWTRRYPMLVNKTSLTPRDRVAGYEISLDYNGLPFAWTARTESQLKGSAKVQLLSVNDAEETKNPCRHLVSRVGGAWHLTAAGLSLLELLTD
jgi:murein DD-endopeptidase MepM/ murein hydrolase activator NlpD